MKPVFDMMGQFVILSFASKRMGNCGRSHFGAMLQLSPSKARDVGPTAKRFALVQQVAQVGRKVAKLWAIMALLQ